MKLLLAEDTRDLNKVIKAVLEHDGYSVDPVFDGEEALEHLKKDSYDGIILDIMMPKKDGIAVLTELRELNDFTPVLLLTAKAEVDDRVLGLEAGADDYLTKPFAMKELIARVHSMLRRHTDYSGKDLKYEDIALDGKNFELSSKNSVRLSIKEYELMQLLIVNSEKELSTDYILEHVWKDEKEANKDTVWLYISYLKTKLISVSSRTTITGANGGAFKIITKE